MRRPRGPMVLAADVEATATTRDVLDGPRSRVWDLIRAPETVVGHMGVVEAGLVDGSPTGLGEIQYAVFRRRRLLTRRAGFLRVEHEVVEYEEGRRAVTLGSGPNDAPVRTEVVLEDLEDGRVALTHIARMVIPEGTDLGAAVSCQHYLDEFCEAISTMAGAAIGSRRRSA